MLLFYSNAAFLYQCNIFHLSDACVSVTIPCVLQTLSFLVIITEIMDIVCEGLLPLRISKILTSLKL